MLIKNIKTLVGVDEDFCKVKKGAEMKNLPTIDNAWLLIEKNKIADFGKMETCPERNEEVIDATEENNCKYQMGKEYLDHDRTEVLKLCSFYSKNLYNEEFCPFWPHILI